MDKGQGAKHRKLSWLEKIKRMTAREMTYMEQRRYLDGELIQAFLDEQLRQEKI